MGLYNVIKFDGVPNKKWILYKYPGNDFLNNSTLIVGVGQVAIAVHGGKIETVFKSGTYQLSTENYPFLRGLVKAVHGGAVPFSMEIYFLNTTVSLKNDWGTQSPIQMIDPKFNIRVRVRANGQYALQLTDYKKFFESLMGSFGDRVLLDYNDISILFRGIVNSKVSVILGEFIIRERISFLDITLYLDGVSELGKAKLKDEFEKYGLSVVNFFFASINVPEEDLAKITDYLNKRAEFDIMGDERYRISRSFDVMEKAASNEGGAGALASAGVGLGMGIGIAPLVGNMLQQSPPLVELKCKSCNKNIPQDAKFCPYCGASTQSYCSNCGKELPKDVAFCPFCGTKQ